MIYWTTSLTGTAPHQLPNQWLPPFQMWRSLSRWWRLMMHSVQCAWTHLSQATLPSRCHANTSTTLAVSCRGLSSIIPVLSAALSSQLMMLTMRQRRSNLAVAVVAVLIEALAAAAAVITGMALHLVLARQEEMGQVVVQLRGGLMSRCHGHFVASGCNRMRDSLMMVVLTAMMVGPPEGTNAVADLQVLQIQFFISIFMAVVVLSAIRFCGLVNCHFGNKFRILFVSFFFFNISFIIYLFFSPKLGKGGWGYWILDASCTLVVLYLFLKCYLFFKENKCLFNTSKASFSQLLVFNGIRGIPKSGKVEWTTVLFQLSHFFYLLIFHWESCQFNFTCVRCAISLLTVTSFS